MKWLKRVLRICFKVTLVFVLIIVTYLLASFSCKYITVNNDYVVPQTGIEVFIVSNGVHADICLPIIKDDNIWEAYFTTESFSTLHENPEYISFGWGDKGFYLDTPTWADLTLKTAVKAAFLPSKTAIHVTYVEQKPILSENVKSFIVTKETFRKIQNYIKAYVSLKVDRSQIIDCCRYPNVHDNFYEAEGSYHMFRTCNVWTNQVLIESGIKTSIWTPFDSGILHQFE
jgi:uncharacterized protein (TIGR02117 family)